MIIAMPMSRDRLASHFTKAAEIGFFNDEFQQILRVDNPATAGGCSAKKAMLELIKLQGTDIVIVQHIGERMLGKLLAAGISVSKGSAQQPLEALLAQSRDLNLRLTHASQGRASLNHAAKGGCCQSHGTSAAGSSGCGCGAKSVLEKSAPAKHAGLMAPGLGKQAPVAAVQYAGFRPVPTK